AVAQRQPELMPSALEGGYRQAPWPPGRLGISLAAAAKELRLAMWRGLDAPGSAGATMPPAKGAPAPESGGANPMAPFPPARAHRPRCRGIAAARLEALPGHRDRGANGNARIKVEHVLVVQTNAALGHGRADRPRGIGPMNAVGAIAQIESTHTKRVHGMAARHPAGQTRVFRHHGGRRCP